MGLALIRLLKYSTNQQSVPLQALVF